MKGRRVASCDRRDTADVDLWLFAERFIGCFPFEGTMGSMEVVEAFPFIKAFLEIDVALVGEQLVELLLIRAMRSLDLPVQLGRAGFDVGVADAEILNMPMEPGLELMSIIGADFSDAEGELVDDVIDEVDGVGLSMAIVVFEGADPSCIVDGGILEAADFLPLRSDESQELDVHLDMMAGDLLVIPLGVDFADARAAWKTVQAVVL